MINLADELSKAYNGDAWHGNNVLSLISGADPTKVFTHPIPNAHSIAELVLHLTAWTEEATERLSGQSAKEPKRGDWPSPVEQSENAWEFMVNDFKRANENLLMVVANLDGDSWSKEIVDERDPSLGTGVDHAQLLNGLIQHHAYHAGQIALLLKF